MVDTLLIPCLLNKGINQVYFMPNLNTILSSIKSLTIAIACLPLAKKELLRVKSGSKAQTWHAENPFLQRIL